MCVLFWRSAFRFDPLSHGSADAVRAGFADTDVSDA
jgi:hypothetical protein